MRLALLNLASLVSVVVGTCSHGTYLQRRDGGGHAGFGYGYADGPLLWQNLSPENSLCKSGKNQSPIDVNHAIALVADLYLNETGTLKGKFENLGTTLQVTPTSGGRNVIFGRLKFSLKQFHFHSPSEHRINGETFPLEMHMVHQSADNKLLVVGLLFDVTQSKNKQSQTIRALADMSSKIGTKGQNVTINQYHNLDLAPIINAIDKTKLQTYPGSLTTPPCTEGVTWVVNPIPLEIDVQTFNAFKKIMKHNSRLLQGPPGSKNTLQQV